MRKFLTLLIFSLLPSFAWAQIGAAPLQRCTIDGDLKGDASFFMQYGRDSWTGVLSANCAVPTYASQRTMNVTFNSALPGFGVSPVNNVHVTISFLTTVPLNELRVFQSVAMKPGATGIEWVLESASLQGLVTIGDPGSTLAQSFQRGTLMIR